MGLPKLINVTVLPKVSLEDREVALVVDPRLWPKDGEMKLDVFGAKRVEANLVEALFLTLPLLLQSLGEEA